VADRPDPSKPIIEEENPFGGEAERPAPRAIRWAFPAVLLGSVMLAFGPWLVRLADVGPLASGFWRLAIALPFLFAIMRFPGGGSARSGRTIARPWAAIILAGLFFALDLAAWHVGILHTRLANATLFANVASFFFAAYGFIATRTLPARAQAAALLFAALGVLLLLGRSYQLSHEHMIGDLLCIAAGLAYAGYMIAVERARMAMPTWPLLAAATLAAAAFLLPVALTAETTIWPHHWGPLLALAIGSQVAGQGLIVFGIGSLPPVVVGLSLLCQPIVAATIGWIGYGEALTLPDFVGAALIAAALVLVRRRPAR
jgi:drug/metabolite transporter (DMT)-like permease